VVRKIGQADADSVRGERLQRGAENLASPVGPVQDGSLTSPLAAVWPFVTWTRSPADLLMLGMLAVSASSLEPNQ
jgi:hypothetical protein